MIEDLLFSSQADSFFQALGFVMFLIVVAIVVYSVAAMIWNAFIRGRFEANLFQLPNRRFFIMHKERYGMTRKDSDTVAYRTTRWELRRPGYIAYRLPWGGKRLIIMVGLIGTPYANVEHDPRTQGL